MIQRRIFTGLFACLSLGFQATLPSGHVNVDAAGVAVGGYDVVSYFEGQPLKGDSARTATCAGATYHFASDANREKFNSNPQKYLPAYGGYCAFGMSRGYKAKVDPTAYTIVGGRLYLNYNDAVSKQWREKQAEYISQADAAWRKMEK